MRKISDKHLGVKPIKPSTHRIDHLSTSFITGFRHQVRNCEQIRIIPPYPSQLKGGKLISNHIHQLSRTTAGVCPRQRTSPGDYFARSDTSAVNVYLNWWLMTRLSFVCLVIWLERGLAILHIHHQICEPHPESVVKLSFYVCHDSSCFIRFHHYHHHHHHHQSSIIFIVSIISNLHHHYETPTIFWKVSFVSKSITFSGVCLGSLHHLPQPKLRSALRHRCWLCIDLRATGPTSWAVFWRRVNHKGKSHWCWLAWCTHHAPKCQSDKNDNSKHVFCIVWNHHGSSPLPLQNL